MEPYRYLIWLSLTWIPTLILWSVYRRDLRPYFKVGLYLNLLTFIPGLIWDYLAMRIGVWYFLPPFSTPLVLTYFPVEELILIASVSWFVLTATVLFKKLFKES